MSDRMDEQGMSRIGKGRPKDGLFKLALPKNLSEGCPSARFLQHEGGDA
jgi:hypothetical protein